MMTSRILLDPTGERSSATRTPLARPSSLSGLTIGLLDISKARGDVFLNALQTQLNARGWATKRYQKPTFARIAPVALKQKITTECDVLIEALAD